MEPMAVSNPSSPSSPSSAQATFLPAFLMGQSQSPNSPGLQSPEKNPYSPYNDPRPRQKLFYSTLSESIHENSYDRGTRRAGPPQIGLFDQDKDETNTSYNPNQTNATFQLDNTQVSFNDSINQSITNRNEFDLMRRDNNGVWVTVFGFAPSCVSVVLSRFLQCGVILEKRFPTQGNWVHLRFSNSMEANKALALNGKLVSTGLMVGVIPYQEKSINETLELTYTSPNRARSLRHSFVSPQRSDSVIVPQNLPQKSTGLVTKAMEYVFGW